jgi:hypothetical protein
VAFSLGDLFSLDGAFGQILIYNGVGQVVSAVMTPMTNELLQLVNETAQTEILSPAILADLVVRNYLDHGSAEAVAKKSGISPSDFALMVKSAGDAVDTTTLIEAYRRKIIGWESTGPDGTGVLDGIREGRLADKWAPVLQQLGMVPIGVADAVDAVVENQISHAQGAEFAYQSGVSAADFQILINTRGNPPSPEQLLSMLRRGIIVQDGTGPDVLSVTQGISEGATKDKWIKPLLETQTVLVPEGRVTTLLRVGAIDKATAIAWFQQLGYDQTAAAAFATEASRTKTQTDKALAKADVLKLYTDRAIDSATAVSLLGELGYDTAEADELLAIQDLHAATVITDAAISRIKSYYIARKITDQQVVTALDSLNVPSDQRTQLIASWAIDRSSNVKLLTEAQIADAWVYLLMDTATAVEYLMALGYTEYDAWVVLSIKAKGPVGTAPPNTVPPLQ